MDEKVKGTLLWLVLGLGIGALAVMTLGCSTIQTVADGALSGAEQAAVGEINKVEKQVADLAGEARNAVSGAREDLQGEINRRLGLREYDVAEGDTAWGIAKKLAELGNDNHSWPALMLTNPWMGQDPDLLYPGQTLFYRQFTAQELRNARATSFGWDDF